MRRVADIAAIIALEVAAAVALLPWTTQPGVETTDFAIFYAAATIVREGGGHALYHAETQEPVLRSILGAGARDLFLHPPFEAAALVPLTYLRVGRAYAVWTLCNLALLGVLPFLFAESISFVAPRPYLGLVEFVFAPVSVALALGQDSVVVLFAISAAYVLCTKKREFAGGLVLSLATVKFQYVLTLVFFLLLARRFRMVKGFMLGSALLALGSLLVTGPAGLVEYFRFVNQFNAHDGYGSLHPALMLNLRGFLAGMGWITHARLYSTLASVAFLALGIVCSQWARTRQNDGLMFSLFVAIAVTASPYTYFQDASILLLPIFLAMDAVLSGHIAGGRGKLLACCCVMMFLWPVILEALGGGHWYDSHIYWMFPLIVLFIILLAAELRPTRAPQLESSALPTSA
jgi:hypothetical protein